MTDEPTTVPPPGAWQPATVEGIIPETSTAKTFRLALSEPMAYLPGQHVVLRLTAPDGYTASRSYSIASAPDGSNRIELTVERLAEGEVSSFLHDDVVVGDQLEVRGPIGGWFVWRADTPAVLIAGGSGIVPLMAMVRLARRLGRQDLARMIVSVRAPDSVYYADELTTSATTLLYTRTAPAGWPRPAGRIGESDVPPEARDAETVYVCGSAGFSDGATGALIGAGVQAERIRVERFGPTR